MHRPAPAVLAVLLAALALASCRREGAPEPPGPDAGTASGAGEAPGTTSAGEDETSSPGGSAPLPPRTAAAVRSAIEQARRTGELSLAGLGLERLPDEVATLTPPVWEAVQGSAGTAVLGSGARVAIANSAGNAVDGAADLYPDGSRPLRRLDLSRNGLRDLPAWFERFAALERLDLSHNRFETIPAAARRLPSLRSLDLADNPVSSVEVAPGDLPALRSLALPRITATQARSLLTIGTLATLATPAIDPGEDAEDRGPEEGAADAAPATNPWQTSTFVPVAGLEAPKGPDPAAGLFLAPARERIVLLSDLADHRASNPEGTPPCPELSPARLKGTPAESRLPALRACAPLYAWGPRGVSLARPAEVSVDASALDACTPERREFDVHVRLRGVDPADWFVASLPADGPTRFRHRDRLLRKGEPRPVPPEVPLPPGFGITAVTWFSFPEQPGAELAVVEAEGFGGAELPLERLAWKGLFLFAGREVTRLAGTDLDGRCDGRDWEFGGALDFGGDGDTDLMLHGDRPMLLERVEGGFRTHTVASMPCRC